MDGLSLLPNGRNEGDASAPLVTNVRAELGDAREQVERILASDTLHAADSVRRLFRFLAEKALAGEADQLKEYSIGVDALGKPASFDPRHDAGVRLLASRLRTKLDEYYAEEGKADPVVIELPRGRFKIAWKLRISEPPPAAAALLPAPPSMDLAALNRWRMLAIAMMLVCIVLVAATRWPAARTTQAAPVSPAVSRWSTDVEALWSPFLSPQNHVIIAFWNPVFVRFQREGSPDILYRKSGTSDWADEVKSPEYAGLKKLLGNPLAKPTLNFTMRGSLVSIFALSQFFGGRRSDISLARLDELSWQQVADNDILLVAPASVIHERQSALPVSPAFVVEKIGIRNLHPLPAEPEVYDDLNDPQQTDGETVELVSVMPGPLGRTRVVSFSGNHSSGLIGSVQSMTDPAFARTLVEKLKEPSGKIPPYYQVVIKVRYRGDIPTYTSYVAHRALAMKQNSTDN